MPVHALNPQEDVVGSARKPTVASPSSAVLPGVIDPACMYRLDEFKARMGWRDASFRAACRAGLKTHQAGKRAYVIGHEAISYVTTRAEQ
jgi:hypothetical protein